MKIGNNREYLMRHFGVAALFSGIGLWFLYDAIFKYSAEYIAAAQASGEHVTSTTFQYSSAAILLAVGIFVALKALVSTRETLSFDDTSMTGSITGGKTVPFSDLQLASKRLWETKRILVLKNGDGECYRIDGWHHTGVDELAKHFI